MDVVFIWGLRCTLDSYLNHVLDIFFAVGVLVVQGEKSVGWSRFGAGCAFWVVRNGMGRKDLWGKISRMVVCSY